MDKAQIDEMLSRDPFEPFRLKLADGSGYDIDNPGLVVAMQTKLLVAFPAADRFAVVSLFQITAVETLGSARPKKRPRKTA